MQKILFRFFSRCNTLGVIGSSWGWFEAKSRSRGWRNPPNMSFRHVGGSCWGQRVDDSPQHDKMTRWGCWGRGQRTGDEESPQQVKITRWGLLGPGTRLKGREKPPMCHFDTLGVVGAGVEADGMEKSPNESFWLVGAGVEVEGTREAPNESKWLVGGRWGRCWGPWDEESPQWVKMTCWGLLVPGSRLKGQRTGDAVVLHQENSLLLKLYLNTYFSRFKKEFLSRVLLI